MFLINEADALVLMAITLASKRQASELVDVISATELIHGFIPSETKLGKALMRLHIQGLISANDYRFALTPAGETVMAGLPRKADTAARVRLINERLAEHAAAMPDEPLPPDLELSAEQLRTAMKEHRKVRSAPGPRLLTPKPNGVEIDYKPVQKWRPGRKPAAAGKSGKNFK
jgi:hypothetical protein